jgi:hypothetical protein
MLIISPEQLTLERGRQFVTQLTCILRQTSLNCSRDHMEKMIFPIFVKYKGMTLPKLIIVQINKVIDGIRKKYFEKDPEFENIFNGDMFPQNEKEAD